MAKLGHDVTCYSNFTKDGSVRGVKFVRWEHWEDEAKWPWNAAVAFIHPGGLQHVKKGTLRVFNQQVNDFAYCPGWEGLVDVATSPASHHQKYLSTLTKFKNWKILPNGCDASIYAPSKERKRSIVYASSPDRGLHWVLELFPRLKKHVPDVECHVYYDYKPGLDKAYEQCGETELAKRYRYIDAVMPKLEGKGVFHHKSVSRETMAKVLSTSRLLAYPCDTVRYTEGFSCTTLEAAAAGCLPVICAADALGEVYGGTLPNVASPYSAHRLEYFELLVKYLTDDDAYASAQAKGMRLGGIYDWSIICQRLQSILKGRAE
jgi:glycosyltransferase involved in cell wall biosynthesis